MKFCQGLLIAVAAVLVSGPAKSAELYEKLPPFYGKANDIFQIDGGSTPVIYISRKVGRDHFELVRADLDKREVTVVLPRIEYEARLLAVDDRFAVVMERGPAQFSTLKVFSRETGEAVARKRLENSSFAASIAGDELRLIQHDFSGPTTDIIRSLFDIRTLKFKGEIRWTSKGTTTFRTGRPNTMLFQGRGEDQGEMHYGLWEIDHDMTVLQWFPGGPGRGRTCRKSAWAEDGGNYYCFEDKELRGTVLETQTPLFTVQNESSRYHAIVAKNGVVFAAQGGYNDGERLTKLYDGEDGRFLGTLPIGSSRMYFAGDYLVATHDVYALNWDGLASPDAALNEIHAAYREAKAVLAAGGSPYDAADVMDRVSLLPLTDDLPELDARDRRILADYALWLSLSFARVGEGYALMKQIDAVSPGSPLGPEIIAAARYRAEILQYPANLPPADEGTGGVFAWSIASSTTMEFGSSGKIIRDGERFAIGCWGCNNPDWRSVEFYDRDSLQWRERVVIVIPAIDSLVASKDRLLVSGNAGDENRAASSVFVIDRDSLEIVKEFDVEDSITLVQDEKAPLLCGQHSCQALDLASLELSDVDVALPTKLVHAGVTRSQLERLAGLGYRQGRGGMGIRGLGSRYAIVEQRSSGNRRHVLVDLEAGEDRPLAESHAGYGYFFSPNGEKVFFTESGYDPVNIHALDARTGAEKILLRIPRRDGERRSIGLALSDSRIFVSIGPDIAVFDIDSGDLLAYETDFIARFKPGNWNVRIARMLVDRGRLIVIPFYASGGDHRRNVQVIDLTVLEALIASRASEFSRAGQILRQAIQPN